MSERKKPDWDQEDVLESKDMVTEGSRGLQVWGYEAVGPEMQAGEASQGTAERAATITDAPTAAEADDASSDAAPGRLRRREPDPE